MEQNRTQRIDPAGFAAEAKSMSLVDCLFEMPVAAAKRVSQEQAAAGARLEARLSSEIRTVIASRLRADDAA